MDVLAGQGWGFALVLLRTAGLLVTVPILGARLVPARIRLALALILAFVTFTGAGSPLVAPPDDLAGLFLVSVSETALGLLAGLSARFALDAALAAGQLIGISMGVGFAALVDPTSGAESNAPGELLLTLAQLSAIALGFHREAVIWLARSVRQFPPGGQQGLEQLGVHAINQAVLGVTLAVRISMPVLAAVVAAYAITGILSRSAPQLSLANVGFSIAILAGGGALYLVVPQAAELVARSTLAALPH
jgi:flagellar biosynthetic protein FliR